MLNFWGAIPISPHHLVSPPPLWVEEIGGVICRIHTDFDAIFFAELFWSHYPLGGDDLVKTKSWIPKHVNSLTRAHTNCLWQKEEGDQSVRVPLFTSGYRTLSCASRDPGHLESLTPRLREEARVKLVKLNFILIFWTSKRKKKLSPIPCFRSDCLRGTAPQLS